MSWRHTLDGIVGISVLMLLILRLSALFACNYLDLLDYGYWTL